MLKLTKTPFWTSATSKSCDRKFLWCGGSEVPTATKIHAWVFPNPNYVTGENCIVQSLDAGGSNLADGLDDSLCTDVNSYICEEGAAAGAANASAANSTASPGTNSSNNANASTGSNATNNANASSTTIWCSRLAKLSWGFSHFFRRENCNNFYFLFCISTTFEKAN